MGGRAWTTITCEVAHPDRIIKEIPAATAEALSRFVLNICVSLRAVMPHFSNSHMRLTCVASQYFNLLAWIVAGVASWSIGPAKSLRLALNAREARMSRRPPRGMCAPRAGRSDAFAQKRNSRALRRLLSG